MTPAGTDANGIPIYTDSSGQLYQSMGGMTVPMGGIPGQDPGTSTNGGGVNDFYNSMAPVDPNATVDPNQTASYSSDPYAIDYSSYSSDPSSYG
jgi:hypothetical protein